MSTPNIDIITLDNMDPLAKARQAAKLKREKKAAAVLACQKGKIAASEARAIALQDYQDAVAKEQAALETKITQARKAMGVRKNESNPIGLQLQIEQWRNEMLLRLYGISKN
jgi:hypothetical protein